MDGLSENKTTRQLRTLSQQSEVDVRQILAEAQSRWLRPLEVCEILSNYAKYGFKLNPVPPVRPCSGSMFLFDRKTLRYFRKDGHNWRKKKDGKTVREAHERLKTGSVDVLHCYYAHGEENSNFQRRCYWMLDAALEHIVLVHYREVTEASRFSMPDTHTSAAPAPSSSLHVANSPDLSGPSDLEHEDGDVAESDEVDDLSSLDRSGASASFNQQQQQQQQPSLLEQIAPSPSHGGIIDSRVISSWGAAAPAAPFSTTTDSSSSPVGIDRLWSFPSVYSTVGVPSTTYLPLQLNGQQQQQPAMNQIDNLDRSKLHESSANTAELSSLKPSILASTFDITVWNELLENNLRNEASSSKDPNVVAMGGEAVYVKQESMNGSTWAEILEQCTTPLTRQSMLEAMMGNSSLEADGGPEAGNSHDFLFGSLVPSPKGILEALSPRGLGREPQTPLEASLRAVTEQKALRAAAEAQQRRYVGIRTDSDALWDSKAAEVGFSKLKSFNNSELGNITKFDSFGRWMSNELGRDSQNFLPSGPSQSGWPGLGMFEDQGVDDMYSLSQQMQVETGLSTLVSQDQRYSIVDFSPEWAYPSGDTKVIVTGMFIGEYSSSSKEHKWCCMFGELEVPAEVIGAGVLRCKAPPHAQGRVSFYVTCGDRQAHSEIREFEYCSALSTAQGLAAKKSGLRTDEEMMLKVRLSRMLLAESNTQSTEASADYGIILDSVLSDAEWSYLQDLAKGSGDLQVFNFQEKLLQMFLKSHMQKWLLSKVQEEGKGPSILDEKGQGVFHMAAALGYDWAVAPLVAAGIPINFRDVHGWTALHWAASYCQDEVVKALLKAGADPGAVTDPTRAFPSGQTSADLAAVNGHRGMAAFLAEINLERRLSSLTLSENPVDIAMSHIAGDNAVAKLSRRESIRRTLSGEEDEPFIAESLQALRNAARAADLIKKASQRLSLQKQEENSLVSLQVDEFGMTPHQLRALMAARTAQKFQNAFRGHHERKQQLAATRIQQKYRGWKQRRDFLDLRQRVVKLQAQVRGNQVRKRLKKLVWSVGILEKAVLRWRRKGAGLRGFKSGEVSAPDKDDDDDEELIKDGRKKNEAAVEKAVTRVQSMVRSRQARAEYFRLRDGSLQHGQFSQPASPQEFRSSTEEQLVSFQHLQHQGQSLQAPSPQGYSDIMDDHLMNFPN
jgi:hypothetical protein